MTATGVLDARRRDEAVRQLNSGRFDVLIVGGGITGAGAALDAASMDSGRSSTTKISREHVVDTPVPGLVSIAGGKFTTYRIMARDVIDAAVADLGRPVPVSVTEQLPLLGSDGLPGVRASWARLAEDFGARRA